MEFWRGTIGATAAESVRWTFGLPRRYHRVVHDIRVRLARPADLPAAACLAAKMVRLHHRFDPHRFMLPPNIEHGYEGFLKGELADRAAVLLVAENMAAQIVGYAYGRIEGINWALLLAEHGELIDLYVDESVRRHGVATALVEEMVRRLEGMGAPRIVLSAAIDNPNAQALFRRLGFRPTMVEMTRERAGD